jgi:hypothetical protein
VRRKGKVVEVVQSPADKPKDLRLGGNLVAAWSVATASLRWCALGRRGGRNLETGRRAATQPHFYRRINPPKSFTPVNNASPLPLSKLAPFEAQLRRVQFLGVCSEREGEASAEPNISANREMGRLADRKLGKSEE